MLIFFLRNKHIRGLYCFIRYLFFTRIKKKGNLPNITKNEEDDFLNKKTYTNFKSFNKLPQNQYIQLIRNYEKRNLIINKSIKKTINNFNGQRVFRLTNNLKFSKDDYKKIKVLSVGPRNEGELYSLMSLGIKKKNITAIDVHSYSPLIQVSMLETADFSTLTFDLITVGWVITYCKNLKKALKNLIKLSSRNTIITIGSTIKNEKQNNVDVSNKNIIKNLKLLNVNFDVLVNKREQNTHNVHKIDLLVIKIR